MSANLVDVAMIDALVRCAIEGTVDSSFDTGEPWAPVTYYLKGQRYDVANRPTQFGLLLWLTNYASVEHRYEERTEAMFGPRGDVLAYRYDPSPFHRRLTIVEALKAISYIEYQSCDRPDYYDGEAHAFYEALKDALIERLNGYGAAPWGFDGDYLRAPARPRVVGS